MIEPYLEDLEKRIDPKVEDALLSEWRGFVEGGVGGGCFFPKRLRSSPPGIDWPKTSINASHTSYEMMALEQLSRCSNTLAGGSGGLLNVRANYGTGILSSVFGAKKFVLEDCANTLPTTWPLEGRTDAIRDLVARGAPDLHAGYGGLTLEMGAYFLETFADYPKISKYVRVYHPDLQGPMDVCELLWGCDLFLALIDVPDLAHDLLNLVTETYMRYMREWEKVVPPNGACSHHWGMLHRGRIMLREDSAMNLSPEMFMEFIEPYDQQLLDAFDGGAVHYCGRGDHFIDRFSEMRGVYAVNLSQPGHNDLEKVFQHTIDRGISIIGLQKQAADEALARGRDLRGLVHCW